MTFPAATTMALELASAEEDATSEGAEEVVIGMEVTTREEKTEEAESVERTTVETTEREVGVGVERVSEGGRVEVRVTGVERV